MVSPTVSPDEGEMREVIPRVGNERQEFQDIDLTVDLPSDDPFINEIFHFADCIETGSEPTSSGRDNLKTMAIVFALYRSLNMDGKSIDVDEVYREGKNDEV